MEEYACVPHIQLPFGAAETLLVLRQRPLAQIVPNDVAACLAACYTFATVEEHARRIRGRTDPHDRHREAWSALAGRWLGREVARARCDRTCRTLERLVNQGMLVPHGPLLQQLRGQHRGIAPSPAVTSLGVITRNRPESLARCLDTYLRNIRDHGRSVEVVVADASDGAFHAERTKSVVAASQARYGMKTSYAGWAAKTSYVAALAKAADLPIDVVRFALLPESHEGVAYGANRNCLQLATVGEVITSVDDDTECSIAAPPVGPETLRVAAAIRDWDVRFFQDRRAALECLPSADHDFLALHERFLGRSLGDCARLFGPSAVSLEGLPGRLARILRDGSGAVRLTSLGIVGDPGTTSLTAHLTLGGQSRERLVASARAYRLACRSREVLRLVPRPTIAAGGTAMGGCMGLDNRRLLPPFMPLYRNEDAVFWQSLMDSDEGALLAAVPAAILHSPPQGHRCGAAYVAPMPLRIHAWVLASSLLAGVRHHMRDAAGRLTAAGRQLADLGALPVADFRECARIALQRSMAALAGQLSRQLDEYGATPRYWAADIRRHLEAITRTLSSPGFPLAADIPSDGTVEGAWRSERDFVRRLGQLYCAWPDIVGAAETLRRRGVRLGGTP
jgi:hypothetical protein